MEEERTMKKKIAFLVTHGTDTMAWGINYLSYAMKNMAFNIAVVGSQIPLEETPNGSDGYLNLESAVFALSSLVPPKVFVPMNSGKMIFENDVWKIDKWDPMAFDGKVVIHKNSNQMIYDQGITLKEKSRIDKLYIVKTGGTIEQSMDQGVLKPDKKKDAVTRFIKGRFGEEKNGKGIYIEEIESYSLMAEDSSNMILDYWQKVADFIAQKAGENNYYAYRDEGIEENVSVIFSTPLNTWKEFEVLAEQKKGIVFVGYGGGNINIKKEELEKGSDKNAPYSSYSPMQFFEGFKKKGGVSILHSHPIRGILDPIYENGRAIFDGKLAMPAMDFSIARCQIKLSYILGNIEKIKEYIQRRQIPEENLEKIIVLLFLSGAVFPRAETKDYFESLWQFQIPERDLLFDYNIKEALSVIEKYLVPKPKRIYTYEEFLHKETCESETGKDKIKRSVLILKPDDIVGENRSGEEIDAAANISAVTRSAFEWDVVTVPLKKGISFEKNLKGMLPECKLIFSEGGRQSAYDEKSFLDIENYATRSEMLQIFKGIIKQRSLSVDSPPVIYICLSHQLAAEAMNQLIDDIIETEEAISSLKGWDSLKTEIKSMRTKIFAGSRFATRKNEKPELMIIDLKKYRPSKGVPVEFRESHDEISRRYSGLIEDYIGFEKVDISMLHNDEVDEKRILYINWALSKLFEFRSRNKKGIPAGSMLWQIPVGVEITSSTFDEEGQVLTEVASMAIYYIDGEGYLYRDFSFQFHPELMLSEEIRQIYSDKEIRPSYCNDGLKILNSSIIASFERFKLF